MSHFDRRQLRYFVAVAEELHFSAAARRLHISQPPLSQQIATLEQDLGVKLLKRNKRKVEITTAGQQFLTDARAILAAMDKAAAQARAAAAGQTGTLRIGLNYSAPFNPQLSRLLRRFTRHHPHVALELHENICARQLDGLYRHALDICFIWPTRDDASPEIAIHPFCRNSLRLAVAREHALAQKPRLTPGDLRGQILFLTLRQTRMAFCDALHTACRAAGFAPDIRTDMIQLPFIMNVVAAGQGLAFMPDFFERMRPEGAIFRACSFLPSAAQRMPLAIAHRKNDDSPLVKNLIAALQPGRERL